nr:uncharacterized protein LOC108080517 isoform X3 [Drosophila kikkawai]
MNEMTVAKSERAAVEWAQMHLHETAPYRVIQHHTALKIKQQPSRILSCALIQRQAIETKMSRAGGTPVNLYDEREVMEEFISCYRHFTALWDSTSDDYLSKQKKEPGYRELLNILQRINGEASMHDVKRKINSLRCCYRRQIKKVQASQTGYKPRLWWYHLMDFLNPVLNIQSPLRVKSESLEDSLDETSINLLYPHI